MQEQFDGWDLGEVEAKVRRSIGAEVVEAAEARSDLDALVAAESLWAYEEPSGAASTAPSEEVLLTCADPILADEQIRAIVDESLGISAED